MCLKLTRQQTASRDDTARRRTYPDSSVDPSGNVLPARSEESRAEVQQVASELAADVVQQALSAVCASVAARHGDHVSDR